MTSPKLCCPYCHEFESRVIDSRTAPNNGHIWRRRRCERCRQKFTTQETVIGQYKPLSSSSHHNM